MLKKLALGTVAVAGVLLGASTAQSAVIVTLTHDGLDGVIASFSGSGLSRQSIIFGSAHTVLAANMGDYTTINNIFFELANPISYSSGVNINSLYIDDDGGALDDGGFRLSGQVNAGTPYDISGSSFVNGLSFSLLNVGTFTNTSGAFEFGANQFTYIIQDVQIPEPATLALVGAGLAGLSVAARRRRKA